MRFPIADGSVARSVWRFGGFRCPRGRSFDCGGFPPWRSGLGEGVWLVRIRLIARIARFGVAALSGLRRFEASLSASSRDRVIRFGSRGSGESALGASWDVQAVIGVCASAPWFLVIGSCGS